MIETTCSAETGEDGPRRWIVPNFLYVLTRIKCHGDRSACHQEAFRDTNSDGQEEYLMFDVEPLKFTFMIAY